MSKRKKHKKRSARSGARTPSFGSNEKQEDLIQTVEALTRAVSNGEIPTVRRLVDDLQANHPEHYRTYSFRAQLASWDGNRDEAVRLSREAMRRGGETVHAVVSHHADILQSAGLHEEALEVLDNQAAEWSDDIKLIRIRFQALIGLHRRAEARKFLEDHIAAGT
ncbi:MAG: tetratricopeptide repeat protein, partial [Thiohalospira sp.]